MYVMVEGLARLLAPILPVTTDELWRALPGTRERSVHFADFPKDLERWQDASLVERWRQLIEIREGVNSALESQRQLKVIGTPLEARVQLTASNGVQSLLKRYASDLPMLFIVSQVTVDEHEMADDARVSVKVERADGTKCVRCWRYVTDISTEPAYAGICGRCVDAVSGIEGGTQ
jgi:isoleucyl-tRNA synthetase